MKQRGRDKSLPAGRSRVPRGTCFAVRPTLAPTSTAPCGEDVSEDVLGQPWEDTQSAQITTLCQTTAAAFDVYQCKYRDAARANRLNTERRRVLNSQEVFRNIVGWTGYSTYNYTITTFPLTTHQSRVYESSKVKTSFYWQTMLTYLGFLNSVDSLWFQHPDCNSENNLDSDWNAHLILRFLCLFFFRKCARPRIDRKRKSSAPHQRG